MQSIRWVLGAAPEAHDNILMWTACCLAFFGFLGLSEFTVHQQSEYDPDTHLSITDIRIDNIMKPTMVYVHIKESKTDPFWKGSTICLAKTDTELCPVLALLPHLVLHGSHPGPLFIMQDHTYLARAKFTDKLRVIIKSARIDDSKYASHNFRSGAATTAAEVSIRDVHIKMLGRWKSEFMSSLHQKSWLRHPSS